MNVKDLTADEKRRLVMGKNDWNNEDFDGKLYRFRLSDGPVGVRAPLDLHDGSFGSHPSIAYPSTQILSHTWNTALAEQQGKAIGCDCVDLGMDVILGPAVNIKRVPICGRNFEYYSEDPLLAGMMARSYIVGVQSEHVGTCLKHFCCNNIEYARLFGSSEVDERTLCEIYLRQFEIALEAKPWTVMCSYNVLNGVLVSENKPLFDRLRGEMGFDGLVMSDWSAVRRSSRSINAGIDLEMPHNNGREKQCIEDLANGLIDPDALDAAASRVIALADKCGAESKLRKVDLTVEEREQIAAKIAEEGIVLLKNKNHALPLSGERLVVTGAPERHYYAGGGSACVVPTKEYVRLGHALAELGYDVCYRETVRENVGGSACMNGSAISAKDELLARDAVIVEVGNPGSVETEGRDRQTIRLSREEEEIILHLAKTGKKVIVVVFAGSAVDMSAWIDAVDAVVWAGYLGQCGNPVLAKVLTGAVNPSGKLTETFALHAEDIPAMRAYHDPDVFRYEEKLGVGYRYFETANAPVLFPFGFGLSYSTFTYGDLQVKDLGDEIAATFTVTNDSDVDGKEAAQLYVDAPAGEADRPVRELKGFAKVALRAHESKTVTVTARKKDLRFVSLATNAWTERKGKVNVQIGKSAHEIVLAADIALA